jgi:catechol-2,3-dioxygenase
MENKINITSLLESETLLCINHWNNVSSFKVIKDVISYAQIQANNQYYKDVLGLPMSKS